MATQAFYHSRLFMFVLVQPNIEARNWTTVTSCFLFYYLFIYLFFIYGTDCISTPKDLAVIMISTWCACNYSPSIFIKTATLFVLDCSKCTYNWFDATDINLQSCIDVRDKTLHVNTLNRFFFFALHLWVWDGKQGEINTRKWSLIRPFSDKGSIYIE